MLQPPRRWAVAQHTLLEQLADQGDEVFARPRVADVEAAAALCESGDIELAGEPELMATTFVGGPKRLPVRYRLRPA